MKHFSGLVLTIALSLALLSSGGAPVGSAREESGYVWTQLTAKAEFSKSYNFQLLAERETLYAFHPEGTWSSPDGKEWKKIGLPNILKNLAFLDYVRFRGAIYALGTFEGNIERYHQTSQVARTADMKNWEIVAKSSNLPNRFFYHPVEFRGKLWIYGGEDSAGALPDAWVSDDAVRWSKAADELPFGRRAGAQFLVFKDSLFMLGEDVWISPDGLHWRCLTPRIIEGDLFGYSAQVLDGRIWLIGCNRSGAFRSEVLWSDDGISWTAERAPWSPRGGVATSVFRGRIVMTGGKYGGPGIAGQTEFVYSNDVWSLAKK